VLCGESEGQREDEIMVQGMIRRQGVRPEVKIS
jgi:hypothetical protein